MEIFPPEALRRRAVLAIDGGGIRGALSLELLAGLEAALQARTGRAGTRLAHHFDLIAGTSVGGIIATLLALGMSVAQVLDFVAANAGRIFVKAPWRLRWRIKYRQEPLEDQIRSLVGADTTLGTADLKTLLLLVMRNATTDSPWIVSNNPKAPFNLRSRDDCNLDVPLWQLVRASAAAPSYFVPQRLVLGRQRPYSFQFVDGALTGFNNPAFKAFQYATTEPYGLDWPTGEERLTVVSVGTGRIRRQQPDLAPGDLHLGYLAATVPVDLIGAADREQDVLCRTFGRCLLGGVVDGELGDLKGARTALEPRLFSYFRLNVNLTLDPADPDGLPALGMNLSDGELKDLGAIDAVEQIPCLQAIGQEASRRMPWSEICRRLP